VLVAAAMKRRLRIAAALACVALACAACARQPSDKRAESVIRKHFKKYAKKYPNTVYGRSGVKDVDVTGQQEIHKHLVAVESFVTLGDGTVQRIYATLEKGPMGWRFLSWEVIAQ
jgi:hypothetical protein